MFKRFAIIILLVIAAGLCPKSFAQSTYLPLEPGAKWTLRNPSVPTPIVIEVLEHTSEGYYVRFASPFGENEWMLREDGERYFLTKYGAHGELGDLPNGTLYFDFSADEHFGWKNVIGNISVDAKNVTVRTERATYTGCIRIRQAKNMSFAFAPGKGFVQFGDGHEAFVLVESESMIGAQSAPQSGAGGNSQPVQHVPGPKLQNTPRPANSSQTFVPPQGKGKVLFSITPDVFANQADTPQNLLSAFGMVQQAGIGFLIHNGKWNELEPMTGQYDFDPLDFNVATAKRLNIPICYTLRIIETVDRAVPGDLNKVSWDDPLLERRLMSLIDAMAPHFDGTVHWFLIGNEIDGYFTRHPNEIPAYVHLYADLSRRLKQLVPGLRVSATLMFGGVDLMDGAMRDLTDKFDFVCFTYYPIRGDFTMQDPYVVARDVDRMRQAARGRRLVLQEIGYPSGAKNGSSEAMQAQFVENVFHTLRANSDFVEAGCFWLLADLKTDLVNSLARYYGMANADVFKSFLQTLGMYDGFGRPKKAWSVYTSEIHAPD